VGTGIAFQPVSNVAAGLMVPYAAWVGLATALNYSVWKNNPVGPPKAEDKAQ